MNHMAATAMLWLPTTVESQLEAIRATYTPFCEFGGVNAPNVNVQHKDGCVTAFRTATTF